jgi:hypothetical protein
VKQQARNELKKAARVAAMATWGKVQQTSAASVVAARQQAVLIATHSIQVGAQSAALQKRHEQQQQLQQRQMKKVLSPKASESPSARAARMWALIRKRVVPVLFKFHDSAWRRRTYFTDAYLNPATDMDHPRYVAKGKITMLEVAQQVEERRKRSKMEEVMRIHKQREEEMRQERVLRLQMIEEQKVKKEQELNKQEQRELMRKANKEKAKIEFLRRVEIEQSERAKVVNQVRGKKDKLRQEREAQAKQESDNETLENKLMYAEDVRFFQNLEKVRKQRLKDYSTKRKLELEKTERDHQPGPSQVASGPGYLSARGKAGGGEELTPHQLALEEERKMHVWVRQPRMNMQIS